MQYILVLAGVLRDIKVPKHVAHKMLYAHRVHLTTKPLSSGEDTLRSTQLPTNKHLPDPPLHLLEYPKSLIGCSTFFQHPGCSEYLRLSVEFTRRLLTLHIQSLPTLRNSCRPDNLVHAHSAQVHSNRVTVTRQMPNCKSCWTGTWLRPKLATQDRGPPRSFSTKGRKDLAHSYLPRPTRPAESFPCTC